jgi:hypothetical protein
MFELALAVANVKLELALAVANVKLEVDESVKVNAKEKVKTNEKKKVKTNEKKEKMKMMKMMMNSWKMMMTGKRESRKEVKIRFS